MILTVMMSTIYEQEIQCHFDSLPPALTLSVMNQIAALLATPKDAIKVKYIDTQMQSGSSDCGIFAVAFVTALANGEAPGAMHFNAFQSAQDEKALS